MKAEHVKAIVDAAAECGVDVTEYKGYSGRGMYGSTTDGVVGSTTDIIQAVALAAFTFGSNGDDGAGDDFVVNMGKIRFDNMGRSEQIAY